MAGAKKSVWFILLVCILGSSVQGGRRADLFLQEPYFQGELGDTLAERGLEDPSVRSPGAHKVLFGHYSAVLETRKKQPAVSVKGRGLLSKIIGSASNTVSKILTAYRRNYHRIIESAINATLGPKNPEYFNELEKCMGTAGICDKMPEMHRKCNAACLGNGHPLLNGMPDLILTILDNFCAPIETIFQKMFDYSGNKRNTFKMFKKYVKTLMAGKKGLLEISKIAAESLLPVLIQKVKTDLMPLRAVTAALDLAMKQAGKTHPTGEDIITNRQCFVINDLPALSEMMNAFYSDSATIDVALGGHTLMASVAKYLPGGFQTPFAATVEGVRMMTGRICGLVATASDGSATECDQIGGFPRVGIPVPQIAGVPEYDAECRSTRPGGGQNDDDEGSGESDKNNDEAVATTEAGGASSAPSRKKRSVGGITSPFRMSSGHVDGNGNLAPVFRKRRSLLVGKKF